MCAARHPRAVVRDYFDQQGSVRMLSLLMLVMGLAPILAPLVGGQLMARLGWRSIFWAHAIYGTIWLTAVAAELNESLPAWRRRREPVAAVIGVYGGLMEGVESGTYVGLEPIGDRMCHHLAYRGDETDWQIWIEDGPRALPCRYVITSKTLKGSPEFAVAFKNWDVAPNLTAEQFQFTPPPGATEIEFLRESRQGADRRKP